VGKISLFESQAKSSHNGMYLTPVDSGQQFLILTQSKR
jgi:hypothetical protein